MSLEEMFEDLEGRLAHLEAQSLRANAEELARAERAHTTLADRVRGAVGERVALHVERDHAVSGRIAEIGGDWILLGENAEVGPRAIVPMAAVRMIEGLPRRVRESSATPIRPRSLGSCLRHVARERVPVVVHTSLGATRGRIAAVGEDHLDLSRATGSDLRASRVEDVVAVPFTAVLALAIS